MPLQIDYQAIIRSCDSAYRAFTLVLDIFLSRNLILSIPSGKFGMTIPIKCSYEAFTQGIRAIRSAWDKCDRTSDAPVTNGPKTAQWESVRVLEQDGQEFMRIVRRLVPSSSDSDKEDQAGTTVCDNRRPSCGLPPSEEELALSDSDPEALSLAAHRPSYFDLMTYDIVYSVSYSVPTLYLTIDGSNIPVGSEDTLSRLYTVLVPAPFKSQLQAVGVLGGLSITHHPLTGIPSYFIHPCRTAEAMHLVLEPLQDAEDEIAPGKVMLIWFGVVGIGVGLAVPPEVAASIA